MLIRHSLCTLGLIFATCAMAHQTPPLSTEDSIWIELSRKLTTADLSGNAKKLEQKIIAIGRKARLFEADGCHLSPVRKGRNEWVLFVRGLTSGEEGFFFNYWLHVGPIGPAVRELPGVDEDDGVIDGSWIRKGRYLIGTGNCPANHSPNFEDGAIVVFVVSGNDLNLKQNEPIEYIKQDPHFVPSTSGDIETRDEQGELRTLEGRRITTATRVRTWQFKDGKYRTIETHTLHDQIWAFDRLVTAVKTKQMSVLAQMIPHAGDRKRLAKQIKACLAAGETRIEGDSTLEALRLWAVSGDKESPFALTFTQTHGHWFVSQISN